MNTSNEQQEQLKMVAKEKSKALALTDVVLETSKDKYTVFGHEVTLSEWKNYLNGDEKDLLIYGAFLQRRNGPTGMYSNKLKGASAWLARMKNTLKEVEIETLATYFLVFGVSRQFWQNPALLTDEKIHPFGTQIAGLIWRLKEDEGFLSANWMAAACQKFILERPGFNTAQGLLAWKANINGPFGVGWHYSINLRHPGVCPLFDASIDSIKSQDADATPKFKMHIAFKLIRVLDARTKYLHHDEDVFTLLQNTKYDYLIKLWKQNQAIIQGGEEEKAMFNEEFKKVPPTKTPKLVKKPGIEKEVPKEEKITKKDKK